MSRRTLPTVVAVLLVVGLAGCSGGEDRDQDMPAAAAGDEASASGDAPATASATPSATASPTPRPVTSPYCDVVVAHRDRLTGIGRDGYPTDDALSETVAAVAAVRDASPRRVAPRWGVLHKSLVDLQRGIARAGLRMEDLADASVTAELSAQQRVAVRKAVQRQSRVPKTRAAVEAQVKRMCRVDLSAS
ncbi:hypothetical protein KV100_18750 [Mumia sp. zg.B21]|uniref:hypothetical protein n=1 Tax=Mumia sp. zg.B21 TaxID=2855447 RepID=UPI001C6F4546|nr:hypothetical protein [Mumia sp. zg.B21]MBW9211692.1 hypothetical protein [Mumia sp. zg.B21]